MECLLGIHYQWRCKRDMTISLYVSIIVLYLIHVSEIIIGVPCGRSKHLEVANQSSPLPDNSTTLRPMAVLSSYNASERSPRHVFVHQSYSSNRRRRVITLKDSQGYLPLRMKDIPLAIRRSSLHHGLLSSSSSSSNISKLRHAHTSSDANFRGELRHDTLKHKAKRQVNRRILKDPFLNHKVKHSLTNQDNYLLNFSLPDSFFTSAQEGINQIFGSDYNSSLHPYESSETSSETYDASNTNTLDVKKSGSKDELKSANWVEDAGSMLAASIALANISTDYSLPTVSDAPNKSWFQDIMTLTQPTIIANIPTKESSSFKSTKRKTESTSEQQTTLFSIDQKANAPLQKQNVKNGDYNSVTNQPTVYLSLNIEEKSKNSPMYVTTFTEQPIANEIASPQYLFKGNPSFGAHPSTKIEGNFVSLANSCTTPENNIPLTPNADLFLPSDLKPELQNLFPESVEPYSAVLKSVNHLYPNESNENMKGFENITTSSSKINQRDMNEHLPTQHAYKTRAVMEIVVQRKPKADDVIKIVPYRNFVSTDNDNECAVTIIPEDKSKNFNVLNSLNGKTTLVPLELQKLIEMKYDTKLSSQPVKSDTYGYLSSIFTEDLITPADETQQFYLLTSQTQFPVGKLIDFPEEAEEEEGSEITTNMMRKFLSTKSPEFAKVPQNFVLTTNPMLPKSTVTPANLKEMCMSYMHTFYKNDNILSTPILNHTESMSTQRNSGLEKNETLIGERPVGQITVPASKSVLNIKNQSTHVQQIPPYLGNIIPKTTTVRQTAQFPYENHMKNHTAHSANFTEKPVRQTSCPFGKSRDKLTTLCLPKEMIGVATATDSLRSSQLVRKTTAVMQVSDSTDTTSAKVPKKLVTQRTKDQHPPEKPHADIPLQYQTTPTFRETTCSETASPAIPVGHTSIVKSTTLSTNESSGKVHHAVGKVLKFITRSPTSSANKTDTEFISGEFQSSQIAEAITSPTQRTQSVPRTPEKSLPSLNTTCLPVWTEALPAVTTQIKHKTGHSPQGMICFPLEASTMILPKEALKLLTALFGSTHSTSVFSESTTTTEKLGPLDLLTKIFVTKHGTELLGSTHSTSVFSESTTTTEKLGPLDLLTKVFVTKHGTEFLGSTHSTSVFSESTTTTEKLGPLDLLTKIFVTKHGTELLGSTHSTSVFSESTTTTEKLGPLDLLTKVFVTKHVNKEVTNITTAYPPSSIQTSSVEVEKGEQFRPKLWTTKGFMVKKFSKASSELTNQTESIPTDTTKSTRGFPKSLMQVHNLFLTPKSTSLVLQEEQNLGEELTTTTPVSKGTTGVPKSSIQHEKEEQFRPTLWTTKGFMVKKVSKTTVASTVSTVMSNKTTDLPMYAKIRSVITRSSMQVQKELHTRPSHFNATNLVAKATKLLTDVPKLTPQTHKEEQIQPTPLTTTTYPRKDITRGPIYTSHSPKQIQKEEPIRPKFPSVSTFIAKNITKVATSSPKFAVKTTLKFTAGASKSSDQIQKEEKSRPTRTVLITKEISKTTGGTVKLALQSKEQSEDWLPLIKTVAAFSPNISKATTSTIQSQEEEENELPSLTTTTYPPDDTTKSGTGTSRIVVHSHAEQQNRPKNFSLPHKDISKGKTNVPKVVVSSHVEQQITSQRLSPTTCPPSTADNPELTTDFSQTPEFVKAEQKLRPEYPTKTSLQGKEYTEFTTGASELSVQAKLEEEHRFKNETETTCLIIHTVSSTPSFTDEMQVEDETELPKLRMIPSMPKNFSAIRFVAGRQIDKTLSDEDLLPEYIGEDMGTNDDPRGEGPWFTYDSSREDLSTERPVGIGNSNIPDSFAFPFSSRNVNLPTDSRTDPAAGHWFSRKIIGEEFRTENLQDEEIAAHTAQVNVMMNENSTLKGAPKVHEEAAYEFDNDLINETLTTECLPKEMAVALTATLKVTRKLTNDMINPSLTTECLPKIMLNAISAHAKTKLTSGSNKKSSTAKYPPKQMTTEAGHRLEDSRITCTQEKAEHQTTLQTPSETTTTEYVLTEMTAPFTVRTISGVLLSHVYKTTSCSPKGKSRIQGELVDFRFINKKSKTSICPEKKSRGRSKSTMSYGKLLLVARIQPKQQTTTICPSNEDVTTVTDQVPQSECLPKEMTGLNIVKAAAVQRTTQEVKSTTSCFPKQMAEALGLIPTKESATECLPKVMVGALTAGTGATHGKKTTTECLPKVMAGALTESMEMAHAKMREKKSTTECLPKIMAGALTASRKVVHTKTDEKKSTTECLPKVMSGVLLGSMKMAHAHENKSTTECSPKGMARTLTRPMEEARVFTDTLKSTTSCLPQVKADGLPALTEMAHGFAREHTSTTSCLPRVISVVQGSHLEEAHRFTDECKSTTSCIPKAMTTSVTAPMDEILGFTSRYTSKTTSCLPTVKTMEEAHGITAERKTTSSPKLKVPLKSTTSCLPKFMAAANTVSVEEADTPTKKAHSTTSCLLKVEVGANIASAEETDVSPLPKKSTTSCSTNVGVGELSVPIEVEQVLIQEKKLRTDPKEMSHEYIAALGEVDRHTQIRKSTAINFKRIKGSSLRPSGGHGHRVTPKKKSTLSHLPKELAIAQTSVMGKGHRLTERKSTTSTSPRKLGVGILGVVGQKTSSTTSCLSKIMASALSSPVQEAHGHKATTEWTPKEMSSAFPPLLGPGQGLATTEYLPNIMEGVYTAPPGQGQGLAFQHEATTECMPKEMSSELTPLVGQGQGLALTECLPKVMAEALTAPAEEVCGLAFQRKTTAECLPKEMTGALTTRAEAAYGLPDQHKTTTECLPKEMALALPTPSEEPCGLPVQQSATKECLPKEIAGALTAPTEETHGVAMQYQATTECLPKEMAGALTTCSGETSGLPVQYKAITECLPKEMAEALTAPAEQPCGLAFQHKTTTECPPKEITGTLTAPTGEVHGLSSQHMVTTEYVPNVMASQLTAPMVHGLTCQTTTTECLSKKIPGPQIEGGKVRFIFKTKPLKVASTSEIKENRGKADLGQTEMLPLVSHATEKVETSTGCSSKVASCAEAEEVELRIGYISKATTPRNILVSTKEYSQGKEGGNSQMEAAHQSTDNNVRFQSEEGTSKAMSDAETAQGEIIHAFVQGVRNGNLTTESLPTDMTGVRMAQIDAAHGLTGEMRQGSSTTECLSTGNTEDAVLRFMSPAQSVPVSAAVTNQNNIPFGNLPKTTAMKAMLLEDKLKIYGNTMEAAHHSEKSAGKFGVKLLGTLFMQTEPRTIPMEGQDLTTTSYMVLQKRSMEQTESSVNYDRESNNAWNGIWIPHFLKKPDR